VSGDAWLAAIITLSMSKIVFLSLIVLTCINVFVSPWWYRRKLIRFWLLVGLTLLSYYLLFPGVFRINTSATSYLTNFLYRFEDLRSVWFGLDVVRATLPELRVGTGVYQVAFESGSLSVYGQLARWLPLFGVVILLGFPIYRRRWLNLARRRPDLGRISMNGVAVVLLAPIYGSMIFGPIFWMMIGISALPLVVRRSINSRPAR